MKWFLKNGSERKKPNKGCAILLVIALLLKIPLIGLAYFAIPFIGNLVFKCLS